MARDLSQERVRRSFLQYYVSWFSLCGVYFLMSDYLLWTGLDESSLSYTRYILYKYYPADTTDLSLKSPHLVPPLFLVLRQSILRGLLETNVLDPEYLSRFRNIVLNLVYRGRWIVSCVTCRECRVDLVCDVH